MPLGAGGDFCLIVMAGLRPGHLMPPWPEFAGEGRRDARIKSGHDE